MLDLIKGSLLYELSDLYDLGGSKILWDAYLSENLASTYAKAEGKLETRLQKLIDDLSALE